MVKSAEDFIVLNINLYLAPPKKAILECLYGGLFGFWWFVSVLVTETFC